MERLVIEALSTCFMATTMVVALIAVTGAAEREIKPVSFIFGDSLSDVGNNNHLSRSLAKSNYPWYGIDFGDGLPTGRYTNGRTICDIVAEKTGLPIPAPILDPSTDDNTVLKQGVNYASGGGGILNETGYLFIQRLCLWRQIEMFQGTKITIAKKIGHDKAEKFFNESIYLMSIGSNDYINNYLLPVEADSWQFAPDDFIDYLISTLRQQLTTLHQLGVRRLLFTGLGPLGCIPLQRVLTTDGSCQQNLNEYAVKFNAATGSLIADLNSKLPGARFLFADGYTFFTHLIENPQAYGFENADTPCCSFGRYRPTLSCVAAAKLCPDRSKYLFWDEYHPSDAANLVIAQSLISSLKLNPGNPANSPAQSPLPSPSPSPSPSSS
eukprot:PITA_27231